jgi:hypothetical protein
MQGSRLVCAQCKHDTSPPFSLAKGGAQSTTRAKSSTTAGRSAPSRLAAMFVDTMQKEKSFGDRYTHRNAAKDFVAACNAWNRRCPAGAKSLSAVYGSTAEAASG